MGPVAYLSFPCAQVLTLFFTIVVTAPPEPCSPLHWVCGMWAIYMGPCCSHDIKTQC